MRALAKTRLAGTATAILPWLLLCAAATSQNVCAQTTSPPSQVVIDQVQLGDVTSVQSLHVEQTPASTTLATTSVGNSGLGTIDHADLSYTASQRLSGGSHALANITWTTAREPASTPAPRRPGTPARRATAAETSPAR